MQLFRGLIGLSLVGAGLVVGACSHREQPEPKLGGESRLRVAQAAEASGDFALAESMYAAAAAAAPKDAAVQLGFADVLVRRGRIGEARAFLARGMKTVSDTEQLRGGLAALYLLEGQPASAIDEFDKVLTSDPKNMRMVVNKAVALDLLGRHDQAQVLYRQALAAAPDDDVVINDLALSMLLAGRAREAEAVAAPLKARTDELAPRMKANLEVLRAANGDPSRASDLAGTATTGHRLMQLSADAAQR
jgi:Flp pilus assembly protein TadD